MDSPNPKSEDNVAPGPSIGLLVQQVVDDGRAFFLAEKELLVTRLSWRARLVSTFSIYTVVGAMLFLTGATIMLVVITAILARYIGWIGAGSVVGMTLILTASYCLIIAKRALNSFMEDDK